MEAMLRIALKGPDENFDNISLKRQFLCGKMEQSIGSYMLTFHVICLLQVTLLVQ